jgi:cell division protein FtsW
MYHFNAERAKAHGTTHLFYICVILLTGTGLITLYSASYAFAQKFFDDSNYFIFKQLFFAGAGMVLFFIFSRINIENKRKFILPLLIAAAALCIIVIIPGLGVERHGASRWVKIGRFSYQPSEMVKFVLPLYLAHILDKKDDNLNTFSSGVLPPVLVTGIFLAFIYAQNNFSTAILIIFNIMVIFLLAGLQYRYFASIVLVFVPISALLVFTREHRVIRLLSYLKPEWDPLGAGYQIRASRLTIVSGGFWGKGIGQGTRKIASVPEIHSDFIFSAFIEETGFLGMLFFIVLLTAFAVTGFMAARRSESVFRRLLAAGFTAMIVSQALLNIAVVVGALPATGVPLPFFSAGGSSLVTTLACAGLIANVARKPNGAGGSLAAPEVNE